MPGTEYSSADVAPHGGTIKGEGVRVSGGLVDWWRGAVVTGLRAAGVGEPRA